MTTNAKGRVERNHGTHQDRLIKKMRRLRISSYEEANQYLMRSYLAEHNARFAIQPQQSADFHDALRADLDLDTVFCLECKRVVSNDEVIRYNNRLLQIEPGQVSSGQTVKVQERRDGGLRVVGAQGSLSWREIEAVPKTVKRRSEQRRPSITIPPLTHPWKRAPTLAPKAALWK